MRGEDDEVKIYRKAQRCRRLTALGFGLVIVAALGMIPWPLGLGPFAWRMFRYDRVDLVFVNITGAPIIVQLDPGRVQEFSSGRVHRMAFLAGDVHLSVRGAEGTLLDERNFYTDNQSVFYNTPGSGCYAVMEASALYESSVANPPLQLVERIHPDDRLYWIPEGVLVQPRGVLPDRAPAGLSVVWIEDVACELLLEENEHLLLAQEAVIMNGRRERLRSLRDRE